MSPLSELIPSRPESYRIEGTKVIRTVDARDSEVLLPRRSDAKPPGATPELFDQGWLQMKEPPAGSVAAGTVSLVDLFAGCGGLSLGVREACRSLGYGLRIRLASDVDPRALAVYAHNLQPEHKRVAGVETLFNGKLGDATLTSQERAIMKAIGLKRGELDLLVGGPPCQGHSDLNNHTRRDDPKNSLYARMARAAEVLRPRHVIIENVPGVRHDRSEVADVTRRALGGIIVNGAPLYNVHHKLLHASVFGVAQTRRRYFIVATCAEDFNFNRCIADFGVAQRSLEWAIHDLQGAHSAELYNTPSKATDVNQKRMDWFFNNDVNQVQFNLPNKNRPKCHKKGGHSYVGVYGRMKWNEPAPTITGGFGCAGQGRFTHPLSDNGRGRTLTPHEAARVQFFPDFFDFSPLWNAQAGGRTALHQMIGNAVPPKLSYVLAATLLRLSSARSKKTVRRPHNQ